MLQGPEPPLNNEAIVVGNKWEETRKLRYAIVVPRRVLTNYGRNELMIILALFSIKCKIRSGRATSVYLFHQIALPPGAGPCDSKF